MTKLHAYLSFDGTCADAMKYYARLFGAKLEALITYGQISSDDQPTPATHTDKVMHAYLVHPGFELMAGDVPPGILHQGISGVMLALTFPTAAEGQRIFNALADGGQVTMPLGETFWADSFGMVTDRYGVPWGINGGPKPQPNAS